VSPLYPCPCCGHRTLPGVGDYDLCPVCYWEDDPNQSRLPWSQGGANGISLVECQQAYLTHGAVGIGHLKKVRQPRVHENRDADWQPLDPADGEVNTALSDWNELDEAEAENRRDARRLALRTLAGRAPGLGIEQVERRLRQLSNTHQIFYSDAEVELFARCLHDPRFVRRHPLQALAWSWRHRRTASWPARISQLRYKPSF
jgi:hypothetical protein